MIESIARKERVETQPANGPCYLWTVPQKPVSVRLPFDVIDRLEREAVEHFRSLTSRGSEIGGVLLGTVVPGSPSLVSVDDFELIECDYSRGPLYRLSDADLGRFERAVEGQLAGGRRVTGFFRSHTRKGVALDAEDVAFFEARFRDPNQVALLVRPFATKASVGAFFIWENGSVRGEASALEFPFRTADLAPARGAGLSGLALPAPPPAPPAARPPARAQIVPIATRREIALPPPVIAPPVVAPPEEAPEPARAEERPVSETRKAEPPASEPRRVSSPASKQEQDKRSTPAQAEPRKQSAQAASRQEAEKSKPATAPAARAEADKPKAAAPAAPAARPEWDKGRASDKTKAAAKPEAEPAKPAAPMFGANSVFDDAPVSEPASGIAGLLAGKTGLIAGVAATVLVLVGLFVYPGFLRQHSTRPAPAAASRQDSSPLSLRVERTANELLLTWNRDAEPIQAAQSARLSISDGERHENYDMDLEQLRKGSIVYMPVTPDVSFRMEVMGQNSQKTASELVRVLRTSPMPGEAAAAPPQATPDATTAAEEAPVEPQPTPRRGPTKPFQAAVLASRLRPASSGDLPEAPVLGGDAPAQPVNLGGMAAPVMRAPVTAPAPAEKKADAPVQGGRVQPGQLISRKEPDYPKLARQTGVKGAVELDAVVGADGKVKSAKVVSGHTMLRRAAVDAVMQWVYRPTLLNGKPVESQTRIVLNFVQR